MSFTPQKTKSLGELTITQALCDWPLYYPLDVLDRNSVDRKNEILELGKKFDGFCVDCATNRIFNRLPTTENVRPVALRGSGPLTRWASSGLELGAVVTFQCSMNEDHLQTWVFVTRRNKQFVKIGQWPSLADSSNLKSSRYRRELGEKLGKELRTAIGLNAHGVGVGAFVYLRRIIESLLESAHKCARENNESWDEDLFQRSRVTERLKILDGYLPAFLVERRDAYSILSKGLHELEDNECKAYFPAVQGAIELILDEHIDLERAKAQRKELSIRLDEIRSKIDSTKLPSTSS